MSFYDKKEKKEKKLPKVMQVRSMFNDGSVKRRAGI